jgi:hypothetical protein
VPLVRLSYGGWREWLSLPERSLLFATLREEESRLVKFPGRSAVCWPVPFFLEVQLHDVRPGPLLLRSNNRFPSAASVNLPAAGCDSPLEVTTLRNPQP